VTALTALLLLLTRPLVGGRFGAMLSGPPDLIVIALDRSSSMETPETEHGRTRRELALDLIARAPREIWRGARWLLVDSATLTPQVMAGPEALPHLGATSGTDMGADIPALMNVAATALTAERPGRAELWLIGDLQASSWQPEDPRWRAAAAALAALPQDVTVRLFVRRGRPSTNRTLQWVGARRVSTGDRLRADITVAVRAEGDAVNEPIMMSWNSMGARSPVEVRPSSQFSIVQRSFEWPPTEPVFWGSVELPADPIETDNRVFFALARPERVRAVVAAEDRECARRIGLALAPFSTGRVEVVCANRGNIVEALSGRLAMIVMQGAPYAEAEMTALRAWAEEGTTVLWLPPVRGEGDGDGGPWGSVESSSPNPWRITVWNRRDGPLQDGADGVPLPMDRLLVHRRRNIHRSADEHIVHALLNDGAPLLVSRRVGRGQFYELATLPVSDWSTLGEGWVWVPLVHRMLEEGGRRWEVAETAVCGRWRPAAGEAWRPLDERETALDPQRAGLFRWGERVVALNRPPEEDELDAVSPEVIQQRLTPLRVVLADGPDEPASNGPERGELSPWLALLAMLALVAESWLLGNEHRIETR